MSDAVDLKERANVLFKKRLFKEAAGLYQKAEDAVPTDPVYPSNLSAALYEAADYAGAFSAILRSWSLLQNANETKNVLALRLSTRLARTLANGLSYGSFSLGDVNDATAGVQGLRARADEGDEPANVEARRLWKEWDILCERANSIGEEDRQQAKIDVARMPLLKQYFDGDTHQYFFMGHDPPMSIVDDYGPNFPSPMQLDMSPIDVLSNLAFFFGGVGDARHVYGSIIGLERAVRRLPPARRSHVRAHFTLNDIHPTIFCRDLVVFALLNKLANGKETPADEKEIVAAIHYTFCFKIIPNVYVKWVAKVVKELRAMLSTTPPSTPSWLHIPDDTAPKLLRILDQWDPLPAARTAEDIMAVSRQSVNITVAHHMINDNSRVLRMFKEEALSKLTTRAATLRDIRQGATEGASRQQVVEEYWNQVTDTLVPPKDVLESLPATKALWEYVNASKAPKRSRSELESMFDRMSQETHANHGANPTLFDPLSLATIRLSYGGWPTDIRSRNYIGDSTRYLETYVERFRLPASRVSSEDDAAASFGTSATFFEAVAKAWKAMREKLSFEFIHGEMNEQLAILRSPASCRPDQYPRDFTRMWLSNVPDYTHGLMNQIIYVMPSLQTHRQAELASNCLLHSASFPEPGSVNYCHTYTLLHPQEVPAYLNCRIDELDAWGIELIGWSSEERKLKTLPPREDVVRWLTRILLNILWAGDLTMKQDCMFGHGVRHMMNLNAYVGLLLYLPKLGYPAHWVSDFLQVLLSDKLSSDVDIFVGPLPIPTSYSKKRVPMRKLYLAPWITELRTVLAHAAPFAPFPLPQISGRDSISIFEGNLGLAQHNLTLLYGNNQNDTGNTHLMFMHPDAPAEMAQRLVRGMRGLLEGKTAHPPADQLAIVTSPDLVDAPNNIVRWRMRIEDYDRMVAEKWILTVYLYDVNAPMGKPIFSKAWRKVADVRTAR
ncbi:hypothetical protein PENSPDRAFT_648881 [Peniophora sp. CONT]|nr:hypothetical protein PENSPDRAFT_648881 [Peniophora sp. CONT]